MSNRWLPFVPTKWQAKGRNKVEVEHQPVVLDSIKIVNHSHAKILLLKKNRAPNRRPVFCLCGRWHLLWNQVQICLTIGFPPICCRVTFTLAIWYRYRTSWISWFGKRLSVLSSFWDIYSRNFMNLVGAKHFRRSSLDTKCFSCEFDGGFLFRRVATTSCTPKNDTNSAKKHPWKLGVLVVLGCVH